MLEGYSNLLGNYCGCLQRLGLLNSYKWSEPGDLKEISPYLRAEEMMNVIQSREYQVKFCHANILTHQKRDDSRLPSTSLTDYANDLRQDSSASGQENSGDLELCATSTDKRTMISKLIMGIGISIVILLITAILLIVFLRR